ncbi:MAG: AsnC family transcriptional regulator [Paracoccaceae bacterium]|nr:AsnC family transcriptional regulator [Paracoccaceae bacterium]
MQVGSKIDRIDVKFLSVLQREGRITNVALADAVGLSQSPCLSGSSGWKRPATSAATAPRSISPSSATP